MTPTQIDATSVRNVLWPADTPDDRVYALLDGARDPRIERMVRLSGLDYECMFAGVESFRFRTAAPYIVHLEPDSDLTGVLLGEAWGQSWGIFLRTPPEAWLRTVRFHFKQFLRVKDESGRILFFRFYDPRVLRTYLPTCNAAEAKNFLGPAASVIAESEHADAVMVYGLGDDGVRVTVSR